MAGKEFCPKNDWFLMWVCGISLKNAEFLGMGLSDCWKENPAVALVAVDDALNDIKFMLSIDGCCMYVYESCIYICMYMYFAQKIEAKSSSSWVFSVVYGCFWLAKLSEGFCLWDLSWWKMCGLMQYVITENFPNNVNRILVIN